MYGVAAENTDEGRRTVDRRIVGYSEKRTRQDEPDAGSIEGPLPLSMNPLSVRQYRFKPLVRTLTIRAGRSTSLPLSDSSPVCDRHWSIRLPSMAKKVDRRRTTLCTNLRFFKCASINKATFIPLLTKSCLRLLTHSRLT